MFYLQRGKVKVGTLQVFLFITLVDLSLSPVFSVVSDCPEFSNGCQLFSVIFKSVQ